MPILFFSSVNNNNFVDFIFFSINILDGISFLFEISLFNKLSSIEKK